MNWTSTRLWVCLIAMGLAQWGLVVQRINEQVWMAVVMTALGAFGIAKTVEYARGKTDSAGGANAPCPPPPVT